MTEENLNLTQKELLIRLDERIKAIQRTLIDMNKQAIPLNEHLYLMKKVNDLDTDLEQLQTDYTNFKTRLIAYYTVLAILGTVAFNFVSSIIKQTFFS